MSRFNRLLPPFALLVAAALPATLRAQAAGGAGGGAGYMQRVNGVLDQLDLTADEKSKVDDVLTDARQDGMKLRSELADLSPEDRQAKVREFALGVTKKIDAQLTPEQAKQFDSKMAEAMKAGAGRKPAAAATQSATGRPGLAARRGGGGPGERVGQFKAALDKLDLTADQKSKIKTMFEDLQPKIAAAREAEPSDRREKMMAVMTDLRTQMSDILTPEQLQSLRESMQAGRSGDGPKAATQPAAAQSSSASMNSDNGMQMTAAANRPAAMMNGDDNMMMAGGNNTAAAKPAAAAAKTAPAGYAVGDIPADFKLDRLDQAPANLSIYKGRVVALVFGSYSCPMFRDRAEDLNRLSQKLGSDAVVALVYTRESNPADGWQTDRNKQARVSVKQTTTPVERLGAAEMTREAFHLSMPIIVDDKDDALASAFGAMPNGCVVLNRAGVVAAKFHWFEPVSTKHAIDEAMTSPVVMTTPASAADLR